MQPVSWGRLDNGMHFYTHYDRVAHISGIGVKCGSIHDPPNKRGTAHFIEHLVVSHLRKSDDEKLDLFFWKYMGDYDEDRKIHTDRVATFYGHDSLLSERDMLRCFDVLASMLRDPVLDPLDTEAERAAAHQEYYYRSIDWLPVLIDDLIHENMYERNPARNRIDGVPEELATITLQDRRKFVRQYYGANNMFVVVLGPSYEKAKSLARKYFDDIKPRPVPDLVYDHSEDFPVLTSIKSVLLSRRGIHQYHVALAFPTETYHSKDAETLDALALILNKRLYRRLRTDNTDFEKGAYRVEVETSRSYVHGLIYVYFATKNKEFSEVGVQRVLAEIERIKHEKVMPEELDMALYRLDNRYRQAHRANPGKLADLIIEAAANGDAELEHLRAFPQRLRRVTRKKIIDTANKYFTPHYLNVSIVPE